MVFPPCCPVQVLSCARCLHHVFLSEQIKMMKMNHSDRKYERMDVHCIYAKNSLSMFRKSKV